jgi:hypothetical protein
MSSLDEDIELMVHNYRKVGDLLSRKVTIGEVRSFMIVDLASQTEAELEKFFAIVKLMKQLREKETHA